MAQLAPVSDAVILVDVMSFTSCVSIAVSRGAVVFPYRWRDETAQAYAHSVRAELARSRSVPGNSTSEYSLSPCSLMGIPRGTRLVLPSPNGSTLTLAAGTTPTFAGCLRNAEAVAHAAMECGKRVAVIPAGERWKDDQHLRPAYEDLIGAGAIIDHLNGALSPEAKAALACYRDAVSGSPSRLEDLFRECGSGKELIEMGYASDIRLIAELNVDHAVPILKDGAYIEFGGGG